MSDARMKIAAEAPHGQVPPSVKVSVMPRSYPMRVYTTTMRRAAELEAIVRGSDWLMGVLRAARRCAAPEWAIGAGVLRDLVWDGRAFDPARVKDVDLAFFDPGDLSPERDRAVERRLEKLLPGVRWDAKNQAAVHTWYQQRFGIAVEPLASLEDAVATWPEFATCVAVRLLHDGRVRFLAPFGLDDLLDGVWRRNPRRVTLAEYRRRLEAKGVRRRWPSVRIEDDVVFPPDGG